ncbi:class II fructose-bisphosphate aldolase [Aerococcaceae bacterium NML180378]|nr:class II fructose-bisphosphate aldolase [Aerococcaceae bacterium NML171108]MCW6676288.1 class II fructose-bisphosphate aldolase [Aerococcaceae bacterium NML180378]
MALIPLRPMIDVARAQGYAQGAFNVNMIEQVKAAIDIHEALRSPLLLQGAELGIGFLGGQADFKQSTLADKQKGAKILGDAVKEFSKGKSIPIALHLDHGKNLDSVKAAIDGGFTSVMYDGSHLPYEENLRNTQEVVEYAHARGVTVEAELGILAGVEDDVFAAHSTYTHPLQALDFVRKTGVDLLAVSYGTMHGANKGSNVKLRTQIVTAIQELFHFEGIDCGIVSHGSSTVPPYIVGELQQLGAQIGNASGISLNELDNALRAGIQKINVDTDIRLASMRNIYEMFVAHPELKEQERFKEVYDLILAVPDNLDPRYVLQPFMHELMYGFDYTNQAQYLLSQALYRGVQEINAPLISAFGSLGKAPFIQQLTLEDMAAFYQKHQ